MNNKIILTFVVIVLLLTSTSSCLKDLDVKPIDENLIVAGNLKDRPGAMKQALAKIYTAFNTQGQTGSDNDINSSDANFTTFIRAMWNCQELSTDEVKCAWGDAGISDLNYQTWTQNNPFLTGVYARIIYIVTLSNDYIRLTAGDSDPDIQKFNAEARFLRALAYYYAIDLFGNPAFTTEADKIGSFFPKQTTRAALFTYVESELKDIETKLGAPKFEYGRADQAAAQMLLARLYLNAGVFTGTPKWADCKTYCDKVINSNVYSLEPNYRKNFSSDNDKSKENIFAINADGIHTQGYVGVTFIVHSSSQAAYIPTSLVGVEGGGWGGNRSTKQFVNVLIDTLATYGNVPVTTVADAFFTKCKDTRVFIRQLAQWDIMNAGIYPQGIGIYKFTNNKADGTKADNYNNTFVSTDFIFFRLADAYLMRAEALLKSGGDKNAALADVNKIRERAFGDASGNITVDKLTESFLLSERGREFYYEAHRRTDLVRFGQFTNGDYVWAWKGGTMKGAKTSTHLNLFPIPGDEVAANSNIKQNPGY